MASEPGQGALPPTPDPSTPPGSPPSSAPAAEPAAGPPAWSRESRLLRIERVESITELTPDWAWGGATGRGVRVAVIDSGVDATHPALDDCVDVDGGVVVEPDGSGGVRILAGPHEDAFGHGTACAGIIHRLAPDAAITSVRVLGPALSSTSDVFVAALSWAVEQGFDIINLSLGSRKRDWALAFHDVCDAAYFKGTFVVTAANNVDRVTYPSLFASVTSVSCNQSTDPFRFHHNPDPPTEFLARGIDVEVPWTDHGTITTTGNSFAAPHIAGIGALILSKHPELRPFQLKTVLWATAANVREAGARGAAPTATSEMAGRLTRTISTAALADARRGARATIAARVPVSRTDRPPVVATTD